MTALTLEAARIMIRAAREKGRALGLKPLGICVLDAGGHLVAFEREDGASLLRFRIAEGKAAGALGMGMGSRALAERAKAQPQFIQALNGVADGKVIPAAGGVLVKGADGAILGAVGISGDTSDQDEICAVAGIETAGFAPQTD